MLRPNIISYVPDQELEQGFYYVRLRKKPSGRSWMLVAEKIFILDKKKHEYITAVYLKGDLNCLADSLSRFSSEWCLNQDAFTWICSRWGVLEIYLFAFRSNKKRAKILFLAEGHTQLGYRCTCSSVEREATVCLHISLLNPSNDSKNTELTPKSFSFYHFGKESLGFQHFAN